MEFNSSEQNKNEPKLDKSLLFEFDFEDDALENDTMDGLNNLDEDFSFKPINSGLGFHNEESIAKPKNRMPQSNMAARSLPTQEGFSPRTQKPKTDLGVSSHELGLDNFYGHQSSSIENSPIMGQKKVQKESQKRIGKSARKAKLRKVPSTIQFASWLIDTFFIALFTLTIVFIGVLLSDMHISMELISLFKGQSPLIFLLFSSFYLMYFSFLDLDKSLGKELFRIKLVSVDGSRLSFTKTFMRSLITLLSISTLGLPLIINFQGRLSETKLVSH